MPAMDRNAEMDSKKYVQAMATAHLPLGIVELLPPQ